MTTLTLNVLLGAILVRMGTGMASMVTQSQHYSRLQVVIDLDTESRNLHFPLTGIPKFPGRSSHIKQKRFRPQLPTSRGTVCSPTRRQLLFEYHSGLVKDSMAKVREGLNRWKKEQETSRGSLSPGVTIPPG